MPRARTPSAGGIAQIQPSASAPRFGKEIRDVPSEPRSSQKQAERSLEAACREILFNGVGIDGARDGLPRRRSRTRGRLVRTALTARRGEGLAGGLAGGAAGGSAGGVIGGVGAGGAGGGGGGGGGAGGGGGLGNPARIAASLWRRLMPSHQYSFVQLVL